MFLPAPEPIAGIRVVGLDPSLRNWGVSQGILMPDTMTLTIQNVDVIQPVLSKGKQVRQNSSDLESAYQLFKGAMEACKGAQAIFIEVPHGSQSARAMASYGICVGVLGALRATGVPFFELTESEVKLGSHGNARNSTKLDMIEWAMKNHPEANWPTYTQHGEVQVSQAKAEHMADATAAIHAGLKSNSFMQMLPLLKFRQAA